MRTQEPLIEIVNLSKTYKGNKEPAVNGITLTINGGEIFGLLGPNGAGKTTTISILCGLFPPTSGDIYIDHHSIKTEKEEIKKVIGVVPQDIALYPNLTARENLRFIGNMYGLRGTALKKRIDDGLERHGLTDSAGKRLATYSGGMKRRINLIAGILHNPKILFLDEPTAGVDVQSRSVIMDHLLDLNRHGMTIIYTSHYMEEAENLCSRVGIIDNGKIISTGIPRQLIDKTPGCATLEDYFIKLTGRALRDG
ncbi:MAG: ABC transporter ATP-binding protein [Bacteroidota bacterium]